jgi:two-component system, NarL family, sensor histidine kinase DesK
MFRKADRTPAGSESATDDDQAAIGSWVPVWRVAGMVFIAYPIARVLIQPPGPGITILALAATAMFAAIIWAVARKDAYDRSRSGLWLAALNLGIIAIATALTLIEPDSGWIVFFYFASTTASMLLPERRAVALIAIAGFAAGVSLLPTEDLASAVVQGVAVSVIGLTVYSMAALRRTNLKLHEARQELAAMAVAEERDRIGRDLHDVLGHSLSLIAIKSELAGRLLPGDPERARLEIADVERVARDSLGAVRETVSGYRRPTLEGELAQARVALDAAGIEPTIRNEVGPLAASEDAVLAWAVREAVTNMVRHSAARHGTITTARHGSVAELEVTDDGHKPSAVREATAAAATLPGTPGSGLRGLRERLERVGGRLEAGPQTDGGYRLVATIPVIGPPVAEA